MRLAETLVAQSETRYDEPGYPVMTYTTVTGWIDPGAARGNAMTARNWLDTSGTWLETHAQYDQCGNVRKAWDARGYVSEVEYNDRFSDGISRNTFAHPTRTISPVPDSGGTFGSATALETTSAYDLSTGLVTSTTDVNNQTTNYQYNDPLDRITRVTRPDSGWTSYAYGDSPANLYVRTQTAQSATWALDSYQYFDGLARPSRSFQYEGQFAGQEWLTSDTQYDSLGRVQRVSHPYRSSGSSSAVNPSGRPRLAILIVKWVTRIERLGREESSGIPKLATTYM